MPTHQHTTELNECLNCTCEFVHPVEWDPAGPGSWSVMLRCPNCDVHRVGVFGQVELDAFEAELDESQALLQKTYERVVRDNMTQEAKRFAHALAAGAILPEDF